MKKMLKIIAMLFVVAAVVSAAGCASKKTATNNTTSSVAIVGGNQSKVATSVAADTNITDNTYNNTTDVNAITANVTGNTGNNTSTVMIEQTTGNTTDQNVTHMSTAQRDLALAKKRVQNSSTNSQ